MFWKHLLIFSVFCFSPTVQGFVKESNPGKDPGYKDTLLHKMIRAAKRDSNAGARDKRLRKRVRAFLEKENQEMLNAINEKGETPLFLAGRYPLTAKFLLQKGADPNLVNQYGRIVFQDVLLTIPNPFLLKIFFKWSRNRPNVSFVDENALSYLQKIWSHPELNLMDKGLPLTWYLWREHDANLVHEDSLSLLQFLLYHVFLATQYFNAQYEKDFEYNGGSVIVYGVSLFKANKKWDHFLNNRRLIKEKALLLIDEGADLSYRDPFGKLPLHQAVRLYNSEIAERIIQKGGALYLTDSEREAVIEHAVKKNYDKVVALLKKQPFSGGELSLKERVFNFCHSVWRGKL